MLSLSCDIDAMILLVRLIHVPEIYIRIVPVINILFREAPISLRRDSFYWLKLFSLW
jgi:hypothetical protein